jgi:hypothetical protein
MPNYLVEWTIDIEADSPREAARKALETQRDEDSIAVCFTIHDGDTVVNVDLLELVTEEPTVTSVTVPVADGSIPSLPRPTTSCGCGYELIWVDGHWEHDAAPYLWGDDHDADEPAPDGQARVDWDLYDRGEF